MNHGNNGYSRRDFLKTLAVAGAVTATLPLSIQRALATPAYSASGSIEDVEHIVIFMQENRSFDHYFGHLSGVRGYNDRFPLSIPGGRNIWAQPRLSDPSAFILPYHLNTLTTSAQVIGDLDHSWYSTHAANAGGLFNAWPLAKTDRTMGYYLREDIPYHYALADAFTVCDHYFASLAGPTHPNRAYQWTGMVDPSGKGGGPLINNNDYITDPKKFPPVKWTTYPERLQKAGVTWQVYQEGTNLSFEKPFEGNYGDNPLQMFQQYVDASNDSPLRKRGISVRGLRKFREDVLHDQLPQVSWIVAPAAYTEHPSYAPAYGAVYIARVLEALTANPKVWSRTALFLNYDENDGIFDHIIPPQPPTPVRPGKSTVSTAGEVHDMVNPGQAPLFLPDDLPYGMGPRVPMIVISPWSRGGKVCSEVFDHTSVLRFVEKRFGVSEPNITDWRRAVAGNLTSAFDFSRTDLRKYFLPSTTNNFALVERSVAELPLPQVPTAGSQDKIISQEVGQRPAMPIDYRQTLQIQADANGYSIHCQNPSSLGICCWAYWDGSTTLPQRYTIGKGHSLEDHVTWPNDVPAAMTIYGPNGFIRKLKGQGQSHLMVSEEYLRNGNIRIVLHNLGQDSRQIQIHDKAYGAEPRNLHLVANAIQTMDFPLTASDQWYDLEIKDKSHTWRLAGHVETGHMSKTDPANKEPVLQL
ncbi:phospholipase C, phosphocholine-specific [Acidithiobacillus montserratensis]|uniref:Phospholipase C, phosphocholine-specific n=1 Tax=Acidithiobacillus montserratensis TaxID=2729135 RepID=A0ACD5HJR9_9PROT|nr:phospholipase C, phosphocholine-specific [Acidithiobacillus montserratensis]MBN2680845.1 phospholipase C, phosphocholine-specific [Acidithiobacillaceae bacterium]MBU2749344.1 phospholipase C, phosphocholine-specific [Acidithiobacillus montserratensis]